MKKTFLLPLFILTSGLALAGCSNPVKNSPFAPGAQNVENLYAFQAATSIGLASGLNSESSQTMKARVMGDDALKDQIIDYLPTVEQILTGLDDVTSAQTEASDREGYATKLTIAFKDAGLKDNSFTMYFNESGLKETTDSNTNTETQNTDTNTETADQTTENVDIAPAKAKEAEDEDDDDEEEDEQETQINGIIVTGENEYPMHGEKEFDPVDNEYEVTFEYHIDETTLVTVEQEIENGETEFEYSIEKDGETIYEYSIEVENNKVELEIKEAGVTENEFSFELVEKDGETLIKAELENSKEEKTFFFKKQVSEDGLVSYIIVE